MAASALAASAAISSGDFLLFLGLFSLFDSWLKIDRVVLGEGAIRSASLLTARESIHCANIRAEHPSGHCPVRAALVEHRFVSDSLEECSPSV